MSAAIDKASHSQITTSKGKGKGELLIIIIIIIIITATTTLSLKKIPTLKFFVTLSNLNQCLNFLHYWKAYKMCYKTHTTLPTSP